MPTRKRSKRVTRLSPFVPVVVPTPTVASLYDGVDVLADGFAEDLTHTLERLGGLRVHRLEVETTVDGMAGDAETSVTTERPAMVDLDAMLAEHAAEFVVEVFLDWPPDTPSPTIELSLCREGGETPWTSTFTLMDGAVWQIRLTMASELVAAATGEPADATPLLRSGARSIAAYRNLCEARCDRLGVAERLQRCERILAEEPDNDEAWLLMPELVAAAGQVSDAEKLIMELPERLPESARAWLQRGLLLHQHEEQLAARAEVMRAAALEGDGLTLYEAGRYLMAIGEEEQAAAALQEAVDRRCTDPFLYEQLGVYRANEGQEVAAVVLWERALAIDPTLHGILANLALGHHRLGNEDRADELFVRAEQQASEHFATHYNLGLYYQDLKNWELARTHIDKALEMRPDLAVLHLNRGIVLSRLGQLREAREAFEKAAHADPSGPVGQQAQQELARIVVAPVDPKLDAREYFQKGADRVKANRAEKAIPYLKEAVRIAPRYWQAWFYLGTCYRLQQRWEASVEAFRKVVTLKDDQADAHNELSVVLGQMGRREEAVIHARRAHDLRSDDPGIISNLGLALMEVSSLDEARHHFQRAREMAPDDPILERCLDELEARQNKG